MKTKKILLTIPAVSLLIISSLIGQNVGINTQTPGAILDINGDVIFRTSDLTVADSLTLALDVNSQKFSCYRLSGADSTFIIAGLTAGMDGRIVTLINESGFPMELNHEDTNALAEDQIITGNHENLVLDDMGLVTLQYDTSAQKWLVNSSNQVAQESVWDTTGTNIFFNNYVGIGTDSPSTPLDIQTEINELGFSHTAGELPITIASMVSDVNASIGTTTDNVFSLNAGGQSKVHVWPDGRVVIGENADPSGLTGSNGESRMTPIESRLTIETPINSTGWMHVGGADSIIVTETIGGISAALGTATNHAFRLNAGSLGRVQIYPDGNVVLGTSSEGAIGKFTVHTPNNSSGISHVSDGGVVLKTLIGGISGGFGTFSNHTLRLFSNGGAALNIEPNGNVILGATDEIAYSKFTVHTLDNSYGLSQVSEGGVQLKSFIGGTSGGIGTFTNHKMRIFANGFSAININPDGSVGIGVDNPLAGYRLSVNGNIKARELVIETTGWPDYVFENNYQPLPLKDVAKFIEQHHHLPNIPSALELEEKGVAVGEMQKKMMEKIEELTLHIIALNNRIEELEKNKDH